MRMIALTTITLIIIAGCSADLSTARSPAAAPSTAPSDGPLASIFGAAPQKAGAQLWSENCTRCHYVRPPDAYSAGQWAVVMQHMRLRANLTGTEEREILRFLQAGSGTGTE
jgi:hypothetical protein